MDKRYQVFVSSTYEDLQEERQEVMRALLELDCIPSGMELFPAADLSQWELIKKVIAECDYYLLILAGRYGSTGSDGKSFTEMEYKHALSISKPVIAFLHKDPGTIAANKTEQTADGKEKLAAFRDFAQKKSCKFWTSPQELGSVVSRSLIQLVKTTPAVGWVRADELPEKEAAEMLRLRKRVEELEAELHQVKTSPPSGISHLAQSRDLHTIHFTASYELEGDTDCEYVIAGEFEASWNSIFAGIAPAMIHEASTRTLQNAIRGLIPSCAIEAARIKHNVHERIGGPVVDEEDFHTIVIQLRALGLIKKSEKPRSVKDTGTYWTLTPWGDELRVLAQTTSDDQA